MKVAVCFSGLLRGDYEATVERMKYVIPEADFFCTTWKGQPTSNIIVREYEQPKMHYHPQHLIIKQYMRLYRKMRDTNWDLSYIPFQKRILGKEKNEEEIKKVITSRNKSKHQTKQILIHAMTCRDFVTDDYDVVIRARYDTYIDKRLKNYIKDLCEATYKHRQPHGFNHFNTKGLQGVLQHPIEITGNRSLDCNDFMIIHRRDMFDHNLVQYLHDQKLLTPAEAGWWMVLCKPYEVWSYEVRGLVRLESQAKNDKLYFDAFKQGDHRQWLYGAKEHMNSALGDIDKHC